MTTRETLQGLPSFEYLVGLVSEAENRIMQASGLFGPYFLHNFDLVERKSFVSQFPVHRRPQNGDVITINSFLLCGSSDMLVSSKIVFFAKVLRRKSNGKMERVWLFRQDYEAIPKQARAFDRRLLFSIRKKAYELSTP